MKYMYYRYVYLNRSTPDKVYDKDETISHISAESILDVWQTV